MMEQQQQQQQQSSQGQGQLTPSSPPSSPLQIVSRSSGVGGAKSKTVIKWNHCMVGCLTTIVLCWMIGLGDSSSSPFPLTFQSVNSDENNNWTTLPINNINNNVTKEGSEEVKEINVYILLPSDPKYMPSIMYTGPAMIMGWNRVIQQLNILPGYQINVNYRDTECYNILSPMEAMRALVSHKVHAFFGPSCELALAPVARFLKFFNVPLLTAGGLTGDYSMNKTNNYTEYFLLTKTGPSFKGMVDFIFTIFEGFNWKKVLLMYDKDDMEEVSGTQTCKFFMSTMVDYLKQSWRFEHSNLDLANNANISLKERMGKATGIKFANVFLGPMCDYVIAPVARYAGVWNIPVLTPGGQAEAFRHKDPQYPTLIRLAGSYTFIGEAFQAILAEFGWRHVALFYHNFAAGSGKGHSFCHFILGTVYTVLNNQQTHFRSFDEEQEGLNFHSFLTNISTKARIVVLCASPSKVREILMAAEDLNMVSSGEYVFFNVELFTNPNEMYRPWLKKNDSDENNERAKRAFEALLTVTVPPPPQTPEYNKFDQEVKKNAKEKFNFSFGDESVNPFVTAFYDAVLLYAIAVNETLEAQGSIDNGTEITRRMRGKTFQGITGNVSIDENGDRNADYSLLDMDPDTGIFRVVAHYSGKNKEITKVAGTKIHWAGNRETWPPDTPKCGFDGSGCPTTPRYVFVVAVLSATLVATLISFIFIYRHYKLEAEIASMTWKVNWVEVLAKGGEAKGRRRGSRMSLARNSIISTYSTDSMAPSGNNKQLFVRTAYYKGNIVAVKKINKDRIELTRSLMLELKNMKDMVHEHLVRFIGASVDAPHLFLLTEYCPRGSLQDILENDQLTLDWTFRYSLMQDIVKAMNYLHSSEIRSHGNLKSSNCVVDSRFVLKVADFGLHSLRAPENNSEDTANSYATWRRKLWTAPEILRMANPPPEGTQKGDVYSFAIIVHEIAARQGPFYTEEDYSPQDIVKILIGKTFLRPSLLQVTYDDETFGDMLQRSWAEDPIERPDFGQLKQILRRLNRNNEHGSSLVDNLLSRMEQYANNLEAVVAERTADYLEEKRKCEEVLYQLLPKSVARSLIQGQPVLAETFDSVTVYFSDIVGFTSLSAESSPMEVVDLLNDLYTCFDSIIENFDVYKVETIGDAYMVVSGLPVRNGIAHAREIARMSLALREAVFKFRIRHRPGDQLKLRIGMHTGPVCAGVVGQKMPRFCLFGDTVNTASRMESNGEPLKIHVSPTTKEALDVFKTFILDLRGEVELKGKGKLSTYWLTGEKREPVPPPPPPQIIPPVDQENNNRDENSSQGSPTERNLNVNVDIDIDDDDDDDDIDVSDVNRELVPS